MLLVIDIGNTKVAVGIFDGEKLLATWKVTTDIRKTPDEYGILLLNLLEKKNIKVSAVDKAILCSVVPPMSAIIFEVCKNYFNTEPLIVGAGIRTGVKISTDNPREVGADRVVNAAAANRLFGGSLIVIDFGTATTLDVVSREGDYLGGAIAPGMGIAAEALHEHTAQLPPVELIPPKSAIGRNTINAMQSGIVYGYVGLIEGLVNRIKKEMGADTRVIATGSYAQVIASLTDIIEKVEPDLTLIGLRIIHELNWR